MKKSIFYSVLFTVAFLSCKSETSKTSTETVEKTAPVSTAKFSLKKAENSINWTAYKTTEKIPVNGAFKEVNIIANGEGNTISEAINNTEFGVPVSSIFTNNSSRDYKIRKFFFSFMDTNILSGKLQISTETTGIATIQMNGITNTVPFTYEIADNVFSMKATLDVNAWNARAAIASLNKVCEELHKGADGVSKTWDEVTLNIRSTF